MAKRKNGNGKPKPNLGWFLVGGAVLAGLGAVYLYMTGQQQQQGFGMLPSTGQILQQGQPSVGNPYINPLTNTPVPLGQVPGMLTPQPQLSTLQTGGVIPYQQNQFCDPTLGLNWDPLQGRCVQQLQGRNGTCAPGSVFNSCQCQCVPANVPQPQCYRDCTTVCPDKINQVWSWCTLGCIPKSAAYGDPGLLACPPLQGRIQTQYYSNLLSTHM